MTNRHNSSHLESKYRLTAEWLTPAASFCRCFGNPFFAVFIVKLQAESSTPIGRIGSNYEFAGSCFAFIDLNQIFICFDAISSIMLLPTFTIGLLSHKIHSTKEIEYHLGRPISVAVIMMITCGQVFYFKRKKWLSVS